MRQATEISIRKRIWAVLFFFLIAFSTLLARFFILQIVQHSQYIKISQRQRGMIDKTLDERGSIYMKDKDGNLIPQAFNKKYQTLVASPQEIKDPTAVADFLVSHFGAERNEVLPKLSKNKDPYEIIVKRLLPSEEQERLIKETSGLLFEDNLRRVYPHGHLASHVTGFTSIEGVKELGRYGLERSFGEYLDGSRNFFQGAGGKQFLAVLGRRILNPPRKGSNIVLGIDYNIQLKTREVLSALVKKWNPVSGAIMITDPVTGKILALEATPSFDPNEFSKEKDFSVFRNPLVESRYELGSVLKPVTIAGALEEDILTPESVYEDRGVVRIGGYEIKNFDERAYGFQTMTQVLEKSLNTGAVYVAKRLGHENQRKYLGKFGLDEKSGIDLPGEVTGDVSNLDQGREIEFATASFGQGVAVTPVGLIMAFGAVANGGKLMKPYLVEEIRDGFSDVITMSPEVRREVISKKTSEDLTKMLVSAVRNGFENRAGVKGYFVAGKTGTAQIPKKEGRGYDSDRVIHSFIGYAPAFSPKFLIYLQLNEPKGNRFAANTLTPAFHDLAEYILNYYEIPPDEK